MGVSTFLPDPAPHAAGHFSRSSRQRIGPIRAIIAFAVLLSVAVAAGTGFFISTLHDRVLAESKRELANTALILARQIESVFSALGEVQKDFLQETIGLEGLAGDDHQEQLASHAMHRKLRDKAIGMPFVGSLTLVNRRGKVINFSRQWPIPQIDVTDRDFFQAFQSDPRLVSYLSKPIANRATGTWVIHLARKISGPNGEFRGLISGAVELQNFQTLFGSIPLESDSSLALFHLDGTMLVRQPRMEAAIGRQFPNLLGPRLVALEGQGVGVNKGEVDGISRMVSAHRIAGYPLLVSANKTEATIFAEWQRTASYVAVIAALTLLAIAVAAFFFIRMFKHHQALTDARAEQQRAEQLREQSLQLDMALANMSQGLCMFDAERRLIVCNKRYADLYGLTEALTRPGTNLREILEHRLARGSAPVGLEGYVDDRLKQVKANKPYQVTQELQDGRFVSIAHQPIPSGGWVATHEDVTEVRRAEAERVRAVEEAELFRARELAAEAASSAKSNFLAVMSHEIRTPMNAVIGLSSVLLESGLDGEQRRVANTIHESSNNLLTLLNDILDVSKLDAGKVEFESAPFSLLALFDNVASIVQASAVQKGLEVRSVIDDAVPAVLIGDQTRIRQVVLNLMTNAIKFSETGIVECSARCLAQADGLAIVECSVRDTGIGIAPDHIGRLFEDFGQADSSISRRFGGTGLGLAICKRIISQMGGDIWVDSTLGVGTTFRFKLELPVGEISELAGHGGQVSADDFALALARLERPLRILLAEDNATNQLVFCKLMQGLNADITVAKNGRVALDHAAKGTFDIVFMDMRMPEMDGLQATRLIRALDGPAANVPIVALTANAFADDVNACRSAGMNEFMSKPIRKKLLVDKLAKLLAGHPLIVQAAKSPRPKAEAALPVTPAAEVAMADVAPTLDRDALRSLIEEIGADGVSEMFAVFQTETVKRLALMRQFSCEADRVQIRNEAHTLKGAAGTVGMRQVAELAKTLEVSALTIAAEDYRGLLDRIETCFRRGRDEMEQALATVLA